MEMCYDGALVMPSSYAVMDEEEMTYVEGGIKTWFNKVSTVAAGLEIAFLVIPALAAANKGSKVAGGIRTAMAAIGWSKKTLVSKVTSMVQKVCKKATKKHVAAAIDKVWDLSGLSISGLIAEGLDRIDGNNNGYCFG